MKEYIAERRGIGVITNLQLSFSGLERAEKGQQGIQGFFNAGNNASISARASPAPVVKPASAKALGKRKAEDTFVDLTLTDDDSSEPHPTKSRERSNDASSKLNDMKDITHERSRSAASTISDSDSDIEVVETASSGPVYQCPLCAAISSLQPDESGDLVAARKRAEKTHEQWHEKYAVANGLSKKAGKDRPPKKKKRKGQQKLKSFFK